MEINDKVGTKNYIADHLSHLDCDEDGLPLRETFLGEQLFSASVTLPWYANIENYLVTNILPYDLTKSQKDNIKSYAKYYVSEHDIFSIITFCHCFACGAILELKEQQEKY